MESIYTDIVFGFYAMIEGKMGEIIKNMRRQSQLNFNHDLQLFSNAYICTSTHTNSYKTPHDMEQTTPDISTPLY